MYDEHRSYHPYTLIDTATLTASLNDNQRAFPAFGKSHLDLEVTYTTHASGAGRTCTVFLEYSSDGVTYYPQTLIGVTTETGSQELLENPLTILGASGATAYRRRVEITEIMPYVRVSAMEDGSASFGTVKIKGTFS